MSKVYERLGFRPIINAYAPMTTLAAGAKGRTCSHLAAELAEGDLPVIGRRIRETLEGR